MDIGYFNARVRGLRGRLFAAPDYEAFVHAPSEAEYRERLRSTPYGRHIDVAEARSEKAGEIIASAVGSSAVEAFKFLWETAPDTLRPHLKALFSTWEVYNLKAIIRGFAKDVKREEIRGVLVPVGEFDSAALNVILATKDLADAARLLDTWGSGYAAALRDIPFTKRLSIFDVETRLDVFACGMSLSSMKGRSTDDEIIRRMLSSRIDALNIMTLVKTAGGGFSNEAVEGFFIEGGLSVNRELFVKSAAAQDAQDMLDALAKAVKDEGLKAILSAADAGEPNLLEEALDAVMEGRLRKAAVTEPLTIATAASFIHMKIREMKNLRLIAKSKLFGIPPEELTGLLIYRH